MPPIPRRGLPIAVVLISGLAASLSPPPAAYAMCDPEGPKDTVIISDDDAGKEVKVKEGQVLVVKLKSQPGTGYGWELAREAAPLKLRADPVLEGGDELAGGVERQVFRFEAKSTGRAKLELHYRRPFGKDREPKKRFEVKVDVIESR